MTAFQSAYRKHHSTESALLNIHNDILLNMAKGSFTALTLLDLSAAFDTIDHTILLDRLNGYHGFILILIYLRFYVAFNSQGHIAMGSLQVEETSAHCTVNHRASASNYQLSNMKRPARDSNRRPQRLEARTLTTTPGISELALGWFKSYLSGRTHSVKVGTTLSNPVTLQHGVPQGSVLGPILFSLYPNPISSIIQSHSSMNYHFYADDTQLYISLSPANFFHSIQKLKNCLNDIQNFMFTNTLKLNPDKTEFILIGSKNNRKQLLPHFPINILGNRVSPAQSVKNLGVVFDSNLTFYDHVSQVIKSTRAHARDLYRIRPLLDLKTAIVLANALVSSRLDYCSSLHTHTFDRRVHKSIKHFSNSFSHYAPVLWNSLPF